MSRAADNWLAVLLEGISERLEPVRWFPATVVSLPRAVSRFLADRCTQGAAALAFYSLTGLVPVLIVTFALVKGVNLHKEMTPYIVQTIGAGSASMTAQIVTFIDQSETRAVGIASAIAALLAAFGILSSAEICLNRIFGDVRGRTLVQKIRAFAGLFVIVPAIMLPPMALTTALRSGSATRRFFDSFGAGAILLKVLDLLPYLLLWVAFTLLYRRLPNTLVRKRSATAGALVAGTLWQTAQLTYMGFVTASVQRNAFYGALWQLPILMVWLYVAWMVVLFGAEVACVHHEIVERKLAGGAGGPSLADAAVAIVTGEATEEGEIGDADSIPAPD